MGLAHAGTTVLWGKWSFPCMHGKQEGRISEKDNSPPKKQVVGMLVRRVSPILDAKAWLQHVACNQVSSALELGSPRFGVPCQISCGVNPTFGHQFSIPGHPLHQLG
eukprot:1145395-Pelagomonas_calceolata.AAC.2